MRFVLGTGAGTYNFGFSCTARQLCIIRLIGNIRGGNRSEIVDRIRQENQGRTVSCPATPSQIPACGATAPGSSNLLTYALTTVIQRVSACPI